MHPALSPPLVRLCELVQEDGQVASLQLLLVPPADGGLCSLQAGELDGAKALRGDTSKQALNAGSRRQHACVSFKIK